MMLLRGLLSMNYETRDAYTFPLQDSQPQVQHGQRTNRVRTRKRVEVSSPSDLFMATFYCCDPMLQSILFEKLFLCKCAVPFFYKDLFSMNYTVALWPLRSLFAVQITEGCYTSCNMIDVKTHVISFARLGRPNLSKSTVLNSLISSENTFYNGTCNGGRSKRNISGFCEMFSSPACESGGDLFKDPTHFLNLRGDLISDFCSEVYSFVNAISDCVVIVIDIQQLERNYDDYINVISKFSSVILLFSEDTSNDVTTERLLERIDKKFDSIGNTILFFESDNINVGVFENTTQLSESLSSVLKENDLKSLHERLFSSILNPIKGRITTDECKDDCVGGNKLAASVIEAMRLELEHWAEKNNHDKKHLFQHCRLVCTPASFVQTKQISSSLRMIKVLRRDENSTHFDEIDKHQADIQKCKQEQTRNISESLKTFLRALQKSKESHFHLEYFLFWFKLCLEKETRLVLNEFKSKKKKTRYGLKEAKKTTPSKQTLGEYEHELHVLNEKIETTRFTVQHFFREISHICNSIIELGLDQCIAGVPINDVMKVYAKLISRGETFELIDGDNSYMASFWNLAVFEYIEKYTRVGKCMCVSILGLQSSGKSTMLNCMFGLNFETGTGRCTRGINGRLLETKISTYGHGHVFVIDLEGLRAPERSITEQNNFDNELATFATGIGDVSLMNIYGENPVELHSVLGVVVYALIRLKHAENALPEGQSCMFVHHCVADETAHQNNLDGTDALIKVLDQVTKEAAKSEHKEHRNFNDVIKFDAISQVFYTPELWQGKEHVKRVNPAYCKMISTIRTHIIQLLVKQGTGLDVTDIGIRTENLWDGILSENFVFSFRNGVEIYQNVNNAINDILWKFEKDWNLQILPGFRRQYRDCVTTDELSFMHKRIQEKAMEKYESRTIAVQQSIEDFFDKCEDRKTAVQWKSAELRLVKLKFEDIRHAAKNQLNSYYTIQIIFIETSKITEQRKNELEIKSRETVEKLSLECSEKDIENSFNTIWEKFEADIRQKLTLMENPNLAATFVTKLNQMCSEDKIHIEIHLRDFTPLEYLQPDLLDKTDVVPKGRMFSIRRIRIPNFLKSEAKTDTQPLVEYVDSLVKSFDKKTEVSEIMVEDFIRNVKTKSELFEATDKTWTKALSMNFVLKSCQFALFHFSDHNEQFHKNYGIDSYISQYRKRMFISFKVSIACKQNETQQIFKSLCSTFLFCLNNAIKCIIEKKVVNVLEREFHYSKPELLREICISLANQAYEINAFEDFISYLRTPDRFGKKWFIMRCEQMLFGEVNNIQSFKEICKRTIDDVFGYVQTSVHDLRDNSEASIRLHEAVTFFSNRFDMLDIDGTEIERVCRSEMDERVNVTDLAKFMDSVLSLEKGNLKSKFCSATVHTIETFINPQYDALFKHLWGCFEKCPFCKEPCAFKYHSVEAAKHRCKQHRFLGCIGVKNEQQTLLRDSCDSLIMMPREWFDCQVVNNKCTKHKGHGKKSTFHYFQDYKSFFPDWDIKPSSDMRGSSTYWKWFMYKFREELYDYYGCTPSIIQNDWSNISKQDAIQSLFSCYNRWQF
ncbi:interferon-induced very large GTPase 1-like isoform X2 [Mya arenaria]|nr:interferon-induced very large GTPase 1-like isoform X2 [Mya arenaria]XP_052819832.1 interferon-induced very large GTPase 1-like isoform X2 [Mya arenaria]